jgi:uncharacterized protein
MRTWNNNSVMRRLRTTLATLVAAGAIGVAAPAVAQEVAPEHLALARQYVDLTDRGAVFESTVVSMGIGTMRQIVSQNPELRDQTSEVIGEVISQYRGRKSELLDQFARVYAIRFSMEELQNIVSFYQSETGQKLAQANAELNEDLSRVLQVYTNNLRTEFFASVRAGLREDGVEL